jgi:hypothetical protein
MSLNLRCALLEEMIEKRCLRPAPDHGGAAEAPRGRRHHVDASSDVVLGPKETLQLAYSVLTEAQKKRFEQEDELDFSFGIQNLARFRGNVFKQRGCVAMVIRMIPFSVKTFDELGLPPVVASTASSTCSRPTSSRRSGRSSRSCSRASSPRRCCRGQGRRPRRRVRDHGLHARRARVHP